MAPKAKPKALAKAASKPTRRALNNVDNVEVDVALMTQITAALQSIPDNLRAQVQNARHLEKLTKELTALSESVQNMPKVGLGALAGSRSPSAYLTDPNLFPMRGVLYFTGMFRTRPAPLHV